MDAIAVVASRTSKNWCSMYPPAVREACEADLVGDGQSLPIELSLVGAHERTATLLAKRWLLPAAGAITPACGDRVYVPWMSSYCVFGVLSALAKEREYSRVNLVGDCDVSGVAWMLWLRSVILSASPQCDVRWIWGGEQALSLLSALSSLSIVHGPWEDAVWRSLDTSERLCVCAAIAPSLVSLFDSGRKVEIDALQSIDRHSTDGWIRYLEAFLQS
jgi:hypothetical protein